MFSIRGSGSKIKSDERNTETEPKQKDGDTPFDEWYVEFRNSRTKSGEGTPPPPTIGARSPVSPKFFRKQIDGSLSPSFVLPNGQWLEEESSQIHNNINGEIRSTNLKEPSSPSFYQKQLDGSLTKHCLLPNGQWVNHDELDNDIMIKIVSRESDSLARAANEGSKSQPRENKSILKDENINQIMEGDVEDENHNQNHSEKIKIIQISAETVLPDGDHEGRVEKSTDSILDDIKSSFNDSNTSIDITPTKSPPTTPVAPTIMEPNNTEGEEDNASGHMNHKPMKQKTKPIPVSTGRLESGDRGDGSVSPRTKTILQRKLEDQDRIHKLKMKNEPSTPPNKPPLITSATKTVGDGVAEMGSSI